MSQFREKKKSSRNSRKQLTYRNPKVPRPIIAIYPSSIRFSLERDKFYGSCKYHGARRKIFGTDRLVRFFRFADPFCVKAPLS